jgi:CHAD domain-containing protein
MSNLRDLPLGSFCRKEARARLRDVKREMLRGRRDQQPDTVHDLRVSIRRFSTVLQVLPECFPAKRSHKARKRLKRILKAAGAVRDRDIALSLVESPQLAAEDGGGSLVEERDQAARELRRALRKRDRNKALAAAKRALRAPKRGRDLPETPGWRPEASASDNAVERLPALIERLFESGRRVLEHPVEIGELHALRLQTKRRRYTLELFAPCYGPELDDRIAQLKRLQDLLGEINDCRASGELSGNEDARAGLDARRNQLIADFGRFWITEFDAPGECESWMLELARHSATRVAAGA